MGGITDKCCGEMIPQRRCQVQVAKNKKMDQEYSKEAHGKTLDSTLYSSTQGNGSFIPSVDHSVEYKSQRLQIQGRDRYGRNQFQIGDFEILGLLGYGSFGGAYLVKPKQKSPVQSSEVYALKCISKKHFRNKKVKQSVKVQRNILMNIRHQFITHLKCSFTNQSYVYLAMEYAKGGSVETLLSIKKIKGTRKNERAERFEKLGEEGVRFIAGSVVLALEHLHKNDIMYRDLKPENILIFDEGYVKLADFGLSKVLHGDDKTRTQAGTVVYFAPEIALKLGYTKLIDLWALGVFIHQLATNQTPFREDEIKDRSVLKETVLKAQEKRKWKNPTLSNEIKDLINKLLKFKPTQRLGANSFEEIKSHAFFKELDWKKLERKQLDSPLLSIITECPYKVKQARGINKIQKTESQNYDKKIQLQDNDYKSLDERNQSDEQ